MITVWILILFVKFFFARLFKCFSKNLSSKYLHRVFFQIFFKSNFIWCRNCWLFKLMFFFDEDTFIVKIILKKRFFIFVFWLVKRFWRINNLFFLFEMSSIETLMLCLSRTLLYVKDFWNFLIDKNNFLIALKIKKLSTIHATKKSLY